MKKINIGLISAVGVLVSMGISTHAMAGSLSSENRLPAWEDYGTKTIDFTNVAINFSSDKTKKRKGNSYGWDRGHHYGWDRGHHYGWGRGEQNSRWGRNDKKNKKENASFFADSEGSTPYPVSPSTFSLTSLTDGYDNVEFDGRIIIDANISSKGKLKTRNSSFGIYSNDPMFGTDRVNYACTQTSGSRLKGTVCETGVLVYGGDLLDFGWSGSQGILEFEIGNLAGWAWDQWEDPADQATRIEHIMLAIPSFDFNGAKKIGSFNTVASGFAVVPVPAAVWLFGSGLIGLMGIARRKSQA